jgi:hypothetical protein
VRERGQSAVEFALILPVLALLVMGMVDFGRIAAQYQAGANAAREAARYCSLHPGVSQATLSARVLGELGTAYQPGDVTVETWATAAGVQPSGGGSSACPNATRGQDSHARVTIRFRPITLLADRWLVQDSKTEARAVMVVP